MILLINACVRSASRTRQLAEQVLKTLDGPVTEVKLWEIPLLKTDEAYLSRRDELIEKGLFSDPMFALARQFMEADRIVIAAPYWDLSFPASLKQYLEKVSIAGLTFVYTPEGIPKGQCKAKELIYVTTAGGTFAPDEYGFDYVKALAQAYFCIPSVRLVKAVGLDILGADPQKILMDAMAEIG